MNKLWIITGISGAGKSLLLGYLADAGVSCADNLPPEMVLSFAENRFSAGISRVAVCCDIRTGCSASDIAAWKSRDDFEVCVVFLDCADAVLQRRFQENRRRHPLQDGLLADAIAKERVQMNDVKAASDVILNTGEWSRFELRDAAADLLGGKVSGMRIICKSFGFKYGAPQDADVQFDLRCLPNPYYVPELKPMSGLDKPVRDYVMQADASKEMFDKIVDLLTAFLPLYEKDGRQQFVAAFGCTGGQHRSVTFAVLVSEELKRRGFENVILVTPQL